MTVPGIPAPETLTPEKVAQAQALRYIHQTMAALDTVSRDEGSKFIKDMIISAYEKLSESSNPQQAEILMNFLKDQKEKIYKEAHLPLTE